MNEDSGGRNVHRRSPPLRSRQGHKHGLRGSARRRRGRTSRIVKPRAANWTSRRSSSGKIIGVASRYRRPGQRALRPGSVGHSGVEQDDASRPMPQKTDQGWKNGRTPGGRAARHSLVLQAVSDPQEFERELGHDADSRASEATGETRPCPSALSQAAYRANPSSIDTRGV